MEQIRTELSTIAWKKNISISGNMFDLLQNISMVCNDLAWEPINGMIGSPSFVVEDLNVIGRG